MKTNVIAKNLAKGSILRLTVLVCSLGVSFYMMPFLVHALGDRLYGFWTVIGTFIGYYGFLDLGLSSAVTRFISRAYGQSNHHEINTVINTAFILYFILGGIALLVSIIAACLSAYFILDYEEVILFRRVILILGVSIAIGFPMRVFTGILTAKIRYDIISSVSLFRLFVNASLIVYFVNKGHGLVTIAFISLFLQIVEFVLFLIFVRIVYRDLRIGKIFFQSTKIKSLFNYSKYSFIAQVADQLRFKVDTFVIAGFLNLSLVTHYFVASRLIEYFVRFIISALGTLTPVYSQFEGKGDFESIKKWFIGGTKISVILSFALGSSIIFYGGFFIERWMGGSYRNSYYILVILCVGIIIALMQTPSIGLLYGISKHKYYAVSNSIEGILNLLLSIVLVRYYGIYGVALGTMIPMIMFKLIIQPIFICRAINLSICKYYFKTILITACKTMIPLLIYFYLTRGFLRADYTSIVIISCVQVMYFIPVVFFFVLGKKEREYFKHVFAG